MSKGVIELYQIVGSTRPFLEIAIQKMPNEFFMERDVLNIARLWMPKART